MYLINDKFSRNSYLWGRKFDQTLWFHSPNSDIDLSVNDMYV